MVAKLARIKTETKSAAETTFHLRVLELRFGSVLTSSMPFIAPTVATPKEDSLY